MSTPPWAAHFGLDRTPSAKNIPAKDLYVESALGVIVGDVGAGKTGASRFSGV